MSPAALALPLALLAAASPVGGADRPWLRALPGDGRSGCCYGLAADAEGGLWFLGGLSGSGSASVDGIEATGHGDADALLVHVTPDGQADRAEAIGGGGPDHAIELAVAPDGAVYVLARFGADARIDRFPFPVGAESECGLLRLEPNGRWAWAIEVPGTGDDGAQAVAVDPRSGAAVVAGTYVRPWSRGDEPEIYLARYGRDGGRTWLRRCEGTGRAVCVDVDGNGRVLLGAASPAADPGTGRRAADGWPLVLCYDVGGGTKWRWEPDRPGGSGAWGRVVAITAEPDGGCRVLGEVRGLVRVGDDSDPSLRGRDLFLARLDGDGALRWLERFGGPDDDTALDLATGSDGSCVVTGTFRGVAELPPWTLEADGAQAGFAAAWDENGSCLWAHVLRGPGASEEEVLPFEVAVAPDGATAVAGWFRDALRLGALTLPGARDTVFLARIPAGTAP